MSDNACHGKESGTLVLHRAIRTFHIDIEYAPGRIEIILLPAFGTAEVDILKPQKVYYPQNDSFCELWP